MQQITIKGVTYEYRLKVRALIALGVKGLGDKEGLDKLNREALADFTAMARLIQAGIPEVSLEDVTEEIMGWTSDDCIRILGLAPADPNSQAEAIPESASGSTGEALSLSPGTTSA